MLIKSDYTVILTKKIQFFNSELYRESAQIKNRIGTEKVTLTHKFQIFRQISAEHRSNEKKKINNANE